MDSKLCAQGTKGRSPDVKNWFMTSKNYLHYWFLPSFSFFGLVSLLALEQGFHPTLGGKKSRIFFLFFSVCNCDLSIRTRVTVLIFFLTLNTSIFKKAKMLFPVVETFKSVCVHVRLGAFACGCQPQMSPTPSSTVKFFVPVIVLGGSWAGQSAQTRWFQCGPGSLWASCKLLGHQTQKGQSSTVM